jgi:transposase-like protein
MVPSSPAPSGGAERVRISCPGCGRNNHVLWPTGQAHFEYRCFNCHKTTTLQRGGRH